jgi:hypothetical protein
MTRPTSLTKEGVSNGRPASSLQVGITMSAIRNFVAAAFIGIAPTIAFAESNLRPVAQAVMFTPTNSESRWLNGVAVPTDSNFFIYESGYTYMTHVEKSRQRLRRVDFVGEKFKLVPYKAELNKELKWSLTAIHRLIVADNDALRARGQPGERVSFKSETNEGCGRIDYFATLDHEGLSMNSDGMDVVVSNKGVFKLAVHEHVENLSCPDGRTILLGTLSCGMSGHCGQSLVGVSLDVQR